MAETRPWHTLEAEEALHAFSSSPQGLEEAEAQRRLSQYGPNVLQEKKKLSPLGLFFGQVKNFLIIIML
ncbi:MAG: cation-transporting P-type ATPase, partial [Chloroflexota bacterium]